MPTHSTAQGPLQPPWLLLLLVLLLVVVAVPLLLPFLPFLLLHMSPHSTSPRLRRLPFLLLLHPLH